MSYIVLQVDNISIDRRWHSSILDVRRFRRADCETDHYLVVAKVRERLAISKQEAHNFDWEKFNLTKLNELEVRRQYQIEITNRFAALEIFSDDEDIKVLGRTLKRISKPQLKRV